MTVTQAGSFYQEVSMSVDTMASDLDVGVIGAGFPGLYSVHRVRDQLGRRLLAIDADSGVGGTWYWNKYPGSRCDIESIHYAYSFPDDLQKEWKWGEMYAAQPEIPAYLNHAAGKFDSRRNIQAVTLFDAVCASTSKECTK